MAFKANIEITSIKEFKELTETKVVKTDKVVKIPEVKEVEVIKENVCAICGDKMIDNSPETLPFDWFANENKTYKVKTITCPTCSNTTQKAVK